MHIALGSDHRGYRLKRDLVSWLTEQDIQFQDFGCMEESSVDYPDIATPVAEAVARGEYDLGILICGTGIGMSITANKVPGIRAALCHSIFTARMAKEHNDANVLCLGGQVIGIELAEEILRTYLEATFQGERHARRVGKISDLEARTLGKIEQEEEE